MLSSRCFSTIRDSQLALKGKWISIESHTGIVAGQLTSTEESRRKYGTSKHHGNLVLKTGLESPSRCDLGSFAAPHK